MCFRYSSLVSVLNGHLNSSHWDQIEGECEINMDTVERDGEFRYVRRDKFITI